MKTLSIVFSSRLALLLLAFTLTTTVTACGSKDKADDKKTETADKAKADDKGEEEEVGGCPSDFEPLTMPQSGNNKKNPEDNPMKVVFTKKKGDAKACEAELKKYVDETFLKSGKKIQSVIFISNKKFVDEVMNLGNGMEEQMKEMEKSGKVDFEKMMTMVMEMQTKVFELMKKYAWAVYADVPNKGGSVMNVDEFVKMAEEEMKKQGK